MGFLKNIFKKKPGGTLFGNLLRGVSSAIPIVGGTVLGTGANKIELGQTQTNKELANQTFAGQPATVSQDGTVNMTTPLNEVSVSAVKQNASLDRLADTLGSFAGKVVGKATENATVGADNKTLMVVGGVGLAIILAMFATKK